MRAVVIGLVGLVACSQPISDHVVVEPPRQATHAAPNRTLVQQDVDAILRGMLRAREQEIVEQIAPRL